MAPKKTVKRGQPRASLSLERIQKAALELIEKHGLPAFSQRALARELGVEAMSLYHWYPSQLDLLNGLLDRVLLELHVPKTGTPVERLRAGAHAFRAIALRYPSFVGGFVLLHRFNTERGLQVLQDMLEPFHDAGLKGEHAARRFRAWMHFMMGALLDETLGYTKGPGATHPLSDSEVAERFPLVTALGPYNKAAHHEAFFDFGLEAVLAGLVAGEPG
jgi:AcrR family transcriptional regulator